jgi:hypothetical protein
MGATASKHRSLVVPSALLGAQQGAAFLAPRPGQGPETVTLLVAAITLSEAAGSGLAGWIASRGIRAQWLLAAAGATLIGLSAALPSGILIAAVALAFLLGLALPCRAALLQHYSADHTRARVASLASACDMACSAIGLSLAGGWRSRRHARRGAKPRLYDSGARHRDHHAGSATGQPAAALPAVSNARIRARDLAFTSRWTAVIVIRRRSSPG